MDCKEPKSKPLNTVRTTHVGRLSGKIVEESLADFSSNIGVHRRPSAVAEGLGAEHALCSGANGSLFW
jgi:hypothetical protein